LRDENTRTIARARTLDAETLTLERTLSDLVNQAYALTLADIVQALELFQGSTAPVCSQGHTVIGQREAVLFARLRACPSRVNNTGSYEIIILPTCSGRGSGGAGGGAFHGLRDGHRDRSQPVEPGFG
jgi:hypothetical protein